MHAWEAFLLGIIQGITEFLPISSSGHLALGRYALGYLPSKEYLFFDLVCHLGTLAAIFLIFHPLSNQTKNKYVSFLPLFYGTLPLFPLALLIKPLKNLFTDPHLLGPCFLISSALLFSGIYFRFPSTLRSSSARWKDSLIIGTFQAVAVFPGISRSGATISAAQLLGWTKEEAIRFSFLLAIPAILGASVLEGVQIWSTPSLIFAVSPLDYMIGFCTSLVVGYGALKLVIWLILKDHWIYFAWYCFLLGLATTCYFNL